MQLIAEHKRSRLDGEEDRLLGVAVCERHLPARPDEDHGALVLWPLELLLNARQEMADGHGLRVCQRLDVVFRHVVLRVIVRVEVAQALLLWQYQQIEAHLLGDLAVVVLEPVHLLLRLRLLLGDDLFRADVVPMEERHLRNHTPHCHDDGQQPESEIELTVQDFPDNESPHVHLARPSAF